MKKRLCIVRHRYFPGDPRMENQLRAALENGFEAAVVCMRGAGEAWYSNVDGIDVYRLPALERKRAGKLRYMLEYLTFCLAAAFFLAALHLRRKQHIIHVQNLPDFLILSALVPRLLGAKLIIDFRECTPELYAADYQPGQKASLSMRVMIWMEQASIRFADLALTCTDTMRDKLVGRGSPPQKTFVMLNVPDPANFAEARLPRADAEPQPCLRLITHGTIKKRYGHEILIHAVALAREKFPGVQLTIAGDGPLRAQLEQLTAQLGVQENVHFTGYVPEARLHDLLRAADCGVVPLLRTQETDIIHTFKMYEYIALGLPVIISRTTAVMAYFDDGCFLYCEPGDPQSLADAILKLHADTALRHNLAAHALEVYEDLSLPVQKMKYAALLKELA